MGEGRNATWGLGGTGTPPPVHALPRPRAFHKQAEGEKAMVCALSAGWLQRMKKMPSTA